MEDTPELFEVAKATRADFPFLAEYKRSLDEFDVLTALRRGEVARLSPWTGQRILATGSIFLGKYHAYRLEEDGRAALEVVYAGNSFALMLKDRPIGYLVREHAYPAKLPPMFERIARHWKRMRPEPATEAVVFLGDTRPLHFLLECGAFLYANRSFFRKMPARPRVLQAPSMIFVGLDTLFGTFLKVTTKDVRQIKRYGLRNNILLISGLRPKIPPQRAIKRFMGWLDGKFSDAPLPDELTVPPNTIAVSIALDIEKERFVGQEDFVDLILQRVYDYAVRASRPLAVFWDGWTVRQSGRSGSDDEVIERIATFAALAEDRFGQRPGITFDKIYDLTLPEKIAFFGRVDCFFATHGTASVVPGVIKGKPGFCFHNPAELSKVFPFRYARAITLSPSKASFVAKREGLPEHHWQYTIDQSAVPSVEEILGHPSSSV